MTSRKAPFIIITLVCALLLAGLFRHVRYLENKGFNPSDDGVILAQSFRLLNAEMPHRDFISIRPCLSGLIHTVHFFSPLPLEMSGRVLALIEFYVHSFLWAFFLCGIFIFPGSRGLKQLLQFVIAGLACFVLNLNAYVFYPWATTDAILLCVIGFGFFRAVVPAPPEGKAGIILPIFALFFASLAPLCKQNFLPVTAFMAAALIYNHGRSWGRAKTAAVLLIGSVPLWGYLVFTAQAGALPDFLRQMTGRREVLGMGFHAYLLALLRSPLAFLDGPLYILAAILWLSHFLKRPLIARSALFSSRPLCTVALIVLSVSLVYGLFSMFAHVHSHDAYDRPFEFFLQLAAIFGLYAYFVPFTRVFIQSVLFILVTAWSTSFSLGINSPLFLSGSLMTTFVCLVFYLMKELRPQITGRIPAIPLHLGFLAAIVCLFAIQLGTGTRFNYRDRPSGELNRRLGDLIPNFGDIRTNGVTFDYYSDFLNIFRSLEPLGARDHFVLLPNNAAIYPMMGSRNPFPLDWVYLDEYLGSEKKTWNMIDAALKAHPVFVVIDRYDTERMADTLAAQTYPEKQYFYMANLLKRSAKLEIDSRYFDVYLAR